jgi:DNA polymerase-3 subunit epsilon
VSRSAAVRVNVIKPVLALCGREEVLPKVSHVSLTHRETTGFGRFDRIVEVAVVVMDLDDGQVMSEFDTLINPMRDVGPTEIHGITATMVEAAPTFGEIAGALLDHLDGSILVAHNLPFDQRFLSQEFRGVGAGWDPGSGICTLSLTHESLSCACQRNGIDLGQHHRALADARAAAGLFQLYRIGSGGRPVRADRPLPGGQHRCVRRDAVTPALMPLRAPRPRVPLPSSGAVELVYLDVLDRFLDDLILTSVEQRELNELASALGLDEVTRGRLESAYFDSYVAAALRDGVISSSENQVLTQLASALSLPAFRIPEVTRSPASPVQLSVTVYPSSAANWNRSLRSWACSPSRGSRRRPVTC